MTTSRRLSIDSESVPETSSKARALSLNEPEVSRFKSLISAPLKGLLKELPNFSKLHDPVAMFLPKSKQDRFIEEQIEEKLPTRPEFAEKTLERFGKMAPYLAGGGIASSIGRGALASLAGQGAEEMGLGQVGQTVAELGAFGSPGLARKIIPSGKEQKALIDTARKYGMSEEQIAPLIPGKGKQEFFSSLASKGRDTQERLKDTRQGISNIYNTLRKGPESKKQLSEKSLQQFSRDMNDLGQEMPHAIRSQLKNDAQDLVSAARQRGGVDVDQLINFFQDISSRYNLGKRELQRFKDPIKKALHSISPEVGQDFEIANNMWQKQYQIGDALYPGQYEGLVDLGESYALAAGVATGDLDLLKKLMGASIARKFAKEMLLSPRMQNISQKSLEAIQNNHFPMIKKLGDLAKYELEKEDED